MSDEHAVGPVVSDTIKVGEFFRPSMSLCVFRCTDVYEDNSPFIFGVLVHETSRAKAGVGIILADKKRCYRVEDPAAFLKRHCLSGEVHPNITRAADKNIYF